MLTDAQFAAIEPLLPPKRRPPTHTRRQVLDAILFLLSSGCSWRQLPKEYGHWHTIYTRFKRWNEAGVLDRVMQELQKNNLVGLRVVFLDSTTVRAHQSAAGARKKRDPNRSEDREASSRRRST
jgi:transposase